MGNLIACAPVPDTRASGSSVPPKPIGFDKWAEAALTWAESQPRNSRHWDGKCLRFAANAFMLDGSPPDVIPEWGWASAWDAINGDQEIDLILNDPDGWQEAPRGALVFFAPTTDNQYVSGTKGNPSGHMGIYLGNGRIIHAYGIVRVDDIEHVENLLNENQIGAYLGWAYPPDRWRP